jgi:mitochondrial chaperone BCS1
MNHPELLNITLTRPGRIDLTIKFDLASKEHIMELFMTMYRADSLEMSRQPTRISQILFKLSLFDILGSNISGHMSGKEGLDLQDTQPVPRSSIEQAAVIFHLAVRFAASLPTLTFSSAEIQGFLLLRKNDPENAVAEAPCSGEKLLATKSTSSSKPAPEGPSNYGDGKTHGEGTEINGTRAHVDVGQGSGDIEAQLNGGYCNNGPQTELDPAPFAEKEPA